MYTMADKFRDLLVTCNKVLPAITKMVQQRPNMINQYAALMTSINLLANYIPAFIYESTNKRELQDQIITQFEVVANGFKTFGDQAGQMANFISTELKSYSSDAKHKTGGDDIFDIIDISGADELADVDIIDIVDDNELVDIEDEPNDIEEFIGDNTVIGAYEDEVSKYATVYIGSGVTEECHLVGAELDADLAANRHILQNLHNDVKKNKHKSDGYLNGVFLVKMRKLLHNTSIGNEWAELARQRMLTPYGRITDMIDRYKPAALFNKQQTQLKDWIDVFASQNEYPLNKNDNIVAILEDVYQRIISDDKIKIAEVETIARTKADANEIITEFNKLPDKPLARSDHLRSIGQLIPQLAATINKINMAIATLKDLDKKHCTSCIPELRHEIVPALAVLEYIVASENLLADEYKKIELLYNEGTRIMNQIYVHCMKICRGITGGKKTLEPELKLHKIMAGAEQLLKQPISAATKASLTSVINRINACYIAPSIDSA